MDSEALFVTNRDRLFRYFVRAVGEAEVARDLTQDVFVRVSRTTVPDGADGEVTGWLFQIARNLVLDYYRKRVRHPRPVTLVDQPYAASQDVTVAVNQALAALPDIDRDVFLMREVAGLGYEEIAQACDLTAGAVRSRIHRARLELRRAALSARGDEKNDSDAAIRPQP